MMIAPEQRQELAKNIQGLMYYSLIPASAIAVNYIYENSYLFAVQIYNSLNNTSSQTETQTQSIEQSQLEKQNEIEFISKFRNLLTQLDDSTDSDKILAVKNFIDSNFSSIKLDQHQNLILINFILYKKLLTDYDFVILSDFLINHFTNISEEDKSKLILMINELNISDLVLTSKYSGLTSTCMCYNQEFNKLTKLLNGINIDKIGLDRFLSLLKIRDNAILKSSLLDCASIMGLVATKGFIEAIVNLYSQFPPRKMEEHFLMLEPEAFKKIFSEEYIHKRYSPKRRDKMIEKFKSVDQGEILEYLIQMMRDVDLHPNSIYKIDGYQHTTLSQAKPSLEQLCDALEQGKSVAVQNEHIEALKKCMDKKNIEFENVKEQILIIKVCATGIIDLPKDDEVTIKEMAKRYISANLEYFISSLSKVKTDLTLEDKKGMLTAISSSRLQEENIIRQKQQQ